MEFKKISSLRRIKNKTRVYNFCVPKYETYIANGFVVHNCQNYKVSQTISGPSRKVLPLELVSLMKEKGVSGIAFTYNEPTVYYEYLMEVGGSGVPVAVKTNGFVTSSVLQDLTTVIGAFNVDIKGDEEEYKRVCDGSLKPVMASVEEIYGSKSHVEISYLVTPRLIKDDSYHNTMLSWLSSMPDIPVHFLYFYPFHRMQVDPYPVEDLIPIVTRFREKLKFVYISNAYNPSVLAYRNTHCPTCHSLLISRSRGIEIVKYSCCGNFVEDLFFSFPHV